MRLFSTTLKSMSLNPLKVMGELKGVPQWICIDCPASGRETSARQPGVG
jgi:hypothetical protein